MEPLTLTTQAFADTFASYTGLFTEWAQIIFFCLLFYNIVWFCLWNAFDKEAVSQGLSTYIRSMFFVTLFYTFMLHPNWIIKILTTSEYMGEKLTGIPIDPSSVIAKGITVGNKIILPLATSSILSFTSGGSLFIFLVYIFVIFIFIDIALELATTLITTSALVAVSPFFFSFSALKTTSQIARQTLDTILANSVKLLGIYLTIGVGSKAIQELTGYIPVKFIAFDPYAWIAACAYLFWKLSRALPNQLARLITGTMVEDHGSGIASIARTMSQAMPLINKSLQFAKLGGGSAAKAVGSIANNAAARLMHSSSQSGVLGQATQALKGTVGDIAKSGAGTISDKFKNLANNLSGGLGAGANGNHTAPGFSERMHQFAQDHKASHENNNSTSLSNKQGNQKDKKPTSKPISNNPPRDKS